MRARCSESLVFFFQAEDGIRDWSVTGVQTCALPISKDKTLQVPWYRAPVGVIDGDAVPGDLQGLVLRVDRQVERERDAVQLSVADGRVEIGRASCRERV